MTVVSKHFGKSVALAAVLGGCVLSAFAGEQSQPTLQLQGKDAVEARRAVFNLIGKNFKPIGAVVKGELAYDAVNVSALAERMVVLTEFLHGTFPEDSDLGEPVSKSRPEIWKQKDDFKKLLKQFRADAEQLASVAATEKSASGAFKEAAGKVAQDCKTCHDQYKLK